jgi:hypothetical protein
MNLIITITRKPLKKLRRLKMKALTLILLLSIAMSANARGLCDGLWPSQKEECRSIIKNSFIDSAALTKCCQKMHIASRKMECLKTIRNIDYSEAEVRVCSDNRLYESQVLNYLNGAGEPVIKN